MIGPSTFIEPLNKSIFMHPGTKVLDNIKIPLSPRLTILNGEDNKSDVLLSPSALLFFYVRTVYNYDNHNNK